MKIILLAALIAISGVACGPISVSDNNIGDIISVGLNVDATVKSDVDVKIVNLLAALLAKIDIGSPSNPPTTPPAEEIVPYSNINIDEMIKTVQEIKQQASGANLSKEEKEQIWRENAEQFARKLAANRH